MDNSKYSPNNVIKSRSGQTNSSPDPADGGVFDLPTFDNQLGQQQFGSANQQPAPSSEGQVNLTQELSISSPQPISSPQKDSVLTGFSSSSQVVGDADGSSWSPMDEPLPDDSEQAGLGIDHFSVNQTILSSQNRVFEEGIEGGVGVSSVFDQPLTKPLTQPLAQPLIQPSSPVVPQIEKQDYSQSSDQLLDQQRAKEDPPSSSQLSSSGASTVSQPPQKSGGGKGLGVAGIMGIVFLLLLSLIAPFILVKNGVRVPVLYPALSKLPTSGVILNSQALTVVREKGEVSVSGLIEVSAKASDGVPAISWSSGTEKALIASYVNKFNNGYYRVKDDSWLVDSMLSIDKKSSINSQVQSSGIGDAKKIWYFNFPNTEISQKDGDGDYSRLSVLSDMSSEEENSSQNIMAIEEDQIKETFLYAGLRPLSFSNLAGSVVGVAGYAFGTAYDKNFARYTYVVDVKKLVDYFPKDATLENAEFVSVYHWGSNLPYKYSFRTDISYLGTSYSYNSTINITKYDSSACKFPIIESFIKEVEKISGRGVDQSTVQKMVTKYGLFSIEVVPNILPEESVISNSDSNLDNSDLPNTNLSSSGSELTSGSETLPTSSQAIKPSGESVSALTSPIIQAPIVPSLVASAQAKERDVQRKQDLSDLQIALANYKKEYGYYPMVKTPEQTLSSQTLFNALVPKFLQSMPVDPLKDSYYYSYQSVDGYSYILRSIAEDSSDLQAKKGGVYYYFEKQG